MANSVEITWYGHGTSGHTLPDGTHVLVDPWLSGPTIPDALRDPARVDLVLLTHGHADHIADVQAVHAKHGCPVVTKFELAVHFGGKGVNVVGFNTGGSIEQLGVRFTMTHAIHSGGIQEGDAMVGYGGEPAGYVITFPGGAKVYQAGDTCVFSDMALIGEIYRPDVAILPIGDLFTIGRWRPRTPSGCSVCSMSSAGTGARSMRSRGRRRRSGRSSRSSVCSRSRCTRCSRAAPPPSDVAQVLSSRRWRRETPGRSADSGSGTCASSRSSSADTSVGFFQAGAGIDSRIACAVAMPSTSGWNCMRCARHGTNSSCT